MLDSRIALTADFKKRIKQSHQSTFVQKHDSNSTVINILSAIRETFKNVSRLSLDTLIKFKSIVILI